jgi:hypothetical protein
MLRNALTVFARALPLIALHGQFAVADTVSAESDALAEITVTATTKQTQSLQKTDAAVTVVISDMLTAQGVTDLREAHCHQRRTGPGDSQVASPF